MSNIFSFSFQQTMHGLYIKHQGLKFPLMKGGCKLVYILHRVKSTIPENLVLKLRGVSMSSYFTCIKCLTCVFKINGIASNACIWRKSIFSQNHSDLLIWQWARMNISMFHYWRSVENRICTFEWLTEVPRLNSSLLRRSDWKEHRWGTPSPHFSASAGFYVNFLNWSQGFECELN